jgi:hypothetical protein
MKTAQFLEYLHEHLGTRMLAEQLAAVLALRGRPDLVPTTVRVSDSRRIAS